eukprot:gene3961-14041_t
MATLEEQLQALLGTIYSAPDSHPYPASPASKAAKKGPHPHIQTVDTELFASDDFRMYCYKIVLCSIRGPHEWTTCGFCHPGEKATRRCPQKYNYTAIACPDYKNGECPRGENCYFAHNVFEYWLHPLRYRTQMCSYGPECRRPTCFFAHQFHELRTNEHLSQLQAIERELEGNDSGLSFHNGSRWGCNNAPSPHRGNQRSSFDIAGAMALLQSHCSVPIPDTTSSAMGNLSPAYPSADLQAALMNILPELLKQLGVNPGAHHGGNSPPTNPTPTPHPPKPSSLAPSSSSQGLEAELATISEGAPPAASALPSESTPPLSKSPSPPTRVASPHSVCHSLPGSGPGSIYTARPDSVLGSEGARSPAPSMRSDEERDETLGAAGFGLTGSSMGLGLGHGSGMGLGMELGHELMNTNNCGLGLEMLNMNNEPTAAELFPSIQELDAQLKMMSMCSTFNPPKLSVDETAADLGV